MSCSDEDVTMKSSPSSPVLLIIDDSDSETGGSSSSESEVENEMIERIYNKQWLTGDDILLGIRVITTVLFQVHSWVTVIDPGILSTYIDSKKKTLYPESLVVVNRRRETLANYFRVTPPQERLILMPIHHDGHWSLLFYMNVSCRFYCMDSMGEYHQQRIMSVISNLIDDCFMPKENIRITFIESLPQIHKYECGQYVFMFIYAMIKQILLTQRDATNSGLPLHPKEHILRRLIPTDINLFGDTLNHFVYERCCEGSRQTFMLQFIEYIHTYLLGVS